MDVDALVWPVGQVLVVVLGDIVGNGDGVQRPALVHAGHLLSHRRQETLRVEEARHPEGLRAALEAPGSELSVTVLQLREPET